MATKTMRVEMYKTEVSSLDESYKINVKLSKVQKLKLLSISNPRYDKLICKQDHLQTITMDDDDAKQQLPIHLVLGNGEYVHIMTITKPLAGRGDGKPVAEKTKFGWVVTFKTFRIITY